MKLGFCSAILPDLSLEEIVAFASEEGFECVELMCWPRSGGEERRYAGVTHVDVTDFDESRAAEVGDTMEEAGVEISALGYYPNPLVPDEEEAGFYIEHIKAVIRASAMLGVGKMNTFIGRDPSRSVEENWPVFEERWPPIIEYAEQQGVQVGIENCPMLFTADEWPGGKNLAYCPAIWRRMFEAVPSDHFGLNYDPSHLVWQGIDYVSPLREFADRIFHVHAKDARVDAEGLDEVGVLGHPLQFHTPKLPGLGDVEWGRFFSFLTDTGYDGAVAVEVEDRAFEVTLQSRKAALRQSAAFLRQFIA